MYKKIFWTHLQSMARQPSLGMDCCFYTWIDISSCWKDQISLHLYKMHQRLWSIFKSLCCSSSCQLNFNVHKSLMLPLFMLPIVLPSLNLYHFVLEVLLTSWCNMFSSVSVTVLQNAILLMHFLQSVWQVYRPEQNTVHHIADQLAYILRKMDMSNAWSTLPCNCRWIISDYHIEVCVCRQLCLYISTQADREKTSS